MVILWETPCCALCLLWMVHPLPQSSRIRQHSRTVSQHFKSLLKERTQIFLDEKITWICWPGPFFFPRISAECYPILEGRWDCCLTIQLLSSLALFRCTIHRSLISMWGGRWGRARASNPIQGQYWQRNLHLNATNTDQAGHKMVLLEKCKEN